MNLAPLGLVLAASTAWSTIFLGFLSPRLLQIHSREVLKAAGAWILVGLISPVAIMHWYLILAIICFIAWVKLLRDRLLGGKVWLSVVSGLGIALGIVFMVQASPSVWPDSLEPRAYALLLASIYLGAAVTALGYVAFVLGRSGESLALVPAHARLMAMLAVFWAGVMETELGLFPRGPLLFGEKPLAFSFQALPISILVVAALSMGAFQRFRRGALLRARWLLAAASVLALLIQLSARWSIL